MQTLAATSSAAGLLLLAAVFISGDMPARVSNFVANVIPTTQVANALTAAGMTDFGGQPMPSFCYDEYTSRNWGAYQPSNDGFSGPNGPYLCNTVPGSYLQPAAIEAKDQPQTMYTKAPLAVLAAHLAGITAGGVSAVERVNATTKTVSRTRNGDPIMGVTNTFAVNAPTLTVPPGQSVQLEWSCQQEQEVGWSTCPAIGPCSGHRMTIPYTSPASQSLVGPGANATGLQNGSVTVTAPATAGLSNSYKLSCPAGVLTSTQVPTQVSGSCPAGQVSIGRTSKGTDCCPAGSFNEGGMCGIETPIPAQYYPVVVIKAGDIAMPTAVMTASTGGAGTHNLAMTVGQTATIHADYTIDPADTAVATAINGGPGKANDQSVNVYTMPPSSSCPLGCGAQWDSVKETKYTPTAPGSTQYWAESKTQAYNWDFRDPTPVTITVSCPAATTEQSGSCVCNDPSLNFDPSSGMCSSGVIVVPPGPPGGGSTGHIDQELKASPTRVRKGTNVTLSWIVSNMTSCGIVGSDRSVPAVNNAANGSNGPHQAIATVNNATIYVLSCVDSETPAKAFTSTVNVGVIPTIIEI
jgi:hypothetical protein